MGEALSTGLELASKMLRRRIAEAARLRESPGVCWALHAALVTPGRLDNYEFAETHPECAW